MTDKLKGSVSIGRTIRVKDFESFRVELTEEFNLDESNFEAEFAKLKVKVDSMISGSPGPNAAKPSEPSKADASVVHAQENARERGTARGELESAEQNKPSPPVTQLGRASSSPNGEPDIDIEKALAKSIVSLKWTKNQYGEWAFAHTKLRGPTPGAEDLLAAIRSSKDGKLYLGKTLYTLSKDEKFLQRKEVVKK